MNTTTTTTQPRAGSLAEPRELADDLLKRIEVAYKEAESVNISRTGRSSYFAAAVKQQVEAWMTGFASTRQAAPVAPAPINLRSLEVRWFNYEGNQCAQYVKLADAEALVAKAIAGRASTGAAPEAPASEQRYVQVACPECGGKGYKKSHVRRQGNFQCSRCDGSGEVSERAPIATSAAPTASASDACKTCGGEGWARDLHDMEQGLIPCEKCKGTGHATAPSRDACVTCGGSKVDPGGLPICRDCGGAGQAAHAGAVDETAIRTIVTKAREFYLGYLSRHIPGDHIDAVRAEITTDTATRAIAFDLRAAMSAATEEPK